MQKFTRMHESAERVSLRRWLRSRNVVPVSRGHEPNDTELLMKQVFAEGGDPQEIMSDARAKVDSKKKGEEGGEQ